MEAVHEIAGVTLLLGFGVLVVVLLSVGGSYLVTWWRWRQVRKQRRV